MAHEARSSPALSSCSIDPAELEQQMTDQSTMGLLPEEKFNYRSLCAGTCLQSLLVVIVAQFGVMQVPRATTALKHMAYTPLVFQSQVTPVTAPPQMKAYIPPVVAQLVVPRTIPHPQILSVPPVPEPPVIANVPPLPQLSKATTTFPPPAVQTGSFLPTTAKPVIDKPVDALKVQTGGFGDPNGVKGHGDGANHLMIASLGVFDMLAGRGRGNGKGGNHGIAGVVSASGFGDAATATATRQQAGADTSAATTPIEILAKPRPNYTEEGRQLRIEGEVQLEVMFTAGGQAHPIRVVRGLGHGLDEQAVRAAEQIKFKPAMHQGRTVDSTAIVHIIFELAS